MLIIKKQDVESTERTKKKKRYAEILRTRVKRKVPVGFQEVPMDIDKINASLTAANS